MLILWCIRQLHTRITSRFRLSQTIETWQSSEVERGQVLQHRIKNIKTENPMYGFSVSLLNDKGILFVGVFYNFSSRIQR